MSWVNSFNLLSQFAGNVAVIHLRLALPGARNWLWTRLISHAEHLRDQWTTSAWRLFCRNLRAIFAELHACHWYIIVQFISCRY